MAKQVDRQALATEYLQLLQSGVPAAEAFKRVYPNGIPTQVQQAAIDAKEKQKNALAGTGGTIAGLLGVKYLSKGLESLGSEAGKEVGKEIIKEQVASGIATGAPEVATVASGEIPGIAAGASNYIPGVNATGVAGAAPVEATGLAFPSITAQTAGPIAAALGATYLGGRAGLDMIKGKKPGLPGRVILGMATGGLSELASPFFKPSTRDIAKSHTKDLLNAARGNDVATNYIQGMREQYNSAPVDPSKPFAGKYANFEEYKRAGLDPKDLTGVYGNLKTFGPEWANLSQEQRENVTQGLIGANLYDSKKGEVVITDPEKAKQIYATMIQAPAVTRPTPATIPAVSEALAKKQLEQTGKFGNQLLQAINGTR